MLLETLGEIYFHDKRFSIAVIKFYSLTTSRTEIPLPNDRLVVNQLLLSAADVALIGTNLVANR